VRDVVYWANQLYLPGRDMESKGAAPLERTGR